MARRYLCVYHDMIPTIENLQPAEVGRLILAALNYDANGVLPSPLPGKEALLWPMFMSQIDRNRESYKVRCEINRNNALSKANRSESQQIVTNRDNRIEKKKEEKVEKEESPNHPTIEEVRAYAKERNSVIDPDFFFDYFSTRNWIDKKGDPVKNWKNKFVTWENSEKKRQAEKKAKEEQKPDLSWFYEDAHGIRT